MVMTMIVTRKWTSTKTHTVMRERIMTSWKRRWLVPSLIGFVLLTALPAYSAQATIYALAIDPLTPTTLYASDGLRILKSTDGGATWSLSTSSYAAGGYQGLAIHPLTPTTLYAFGGKTTDGGATWTATGPPPFSVSAVVVDPLTPTTVYAMGYVCGIDDAGWCYDAEMVKSTDGGTSWFGTGLVARQLTIDPVTPTTLYAVAGMNPYALHGPGLFKSVDGGVSWLLIHEWLVGPAIDPVTPTTVYASDAGGRVFKSIDGGATWGDIGSTGVPVWTFAIDPVNPTTLYGLGAPSGVTKSTDGGATWSATGLLFGPPDYFVHPFAIDPLTPTTLYAATDAGAFKSTDGGAHWSPTGQGRELEAPETTIGSATDGNGDPVAAGAATVSRSITFKFTGFDATALAGFECRLDTANFASCTSPVTYTSLTLGTHAFEVRAVDASGNRDGTPAQHTLIVDSRPETTITSAVDSKGKPIPNGGTTQSTAITFRFTGTDNIAVAGFQCSFDGYAFVSCVSPRSYTNQTPGLHSFRVRAVDSGGFHDATPGAFSWRQR
jgi:hypothetical protein